MNMRIESLEVMNHLQAGMEVGSTELKRQSDQAKRFGNEGYKTHPQLNGVKGAVQSLQPDQLLKVLKNTQQALGGNGGTTRVDEQAMPQLQAPTSGSTRTSDGPKLSASATMTKLLAEISQLTAESTLTNLITKLEGLKAMMEGANGAYGRLAGELEQLGEAWANASDALKEAQQQAKELSQDVDKAQSALESAREKLSNLEAEAAKQDPVPEALQKEIDAAKAAVSTAQTTLSQAKTASNNFVEKTLDPAIKAEQAARTALDTTLSQSQALLKNLSPQQQSAIEQHRKQANEQAKSLTFLMALISQLIDKSSSEDLKATAELKQKLAEAAAKDSEKKAKEYEEEVRKAEELQKTMGCIGKILGWLITAVSFAAAIFTGGASLALATIGLMLAMGDEIYQAVKGESFMAKAMEPLMEYIVKPLMEVMSSIFTAMLISMGVDKEMAETVGGILGAIAAAVVLVAGVMVAGTAVSRFAGSMMKKIGSDVAGETSKNIAKNVAMGVQKEVVRDVTKNVVKTVGKDVAEEVAEEVAQKATKTTMQRLIDSALGQVIKRLNQGLGRSMGMSDIKMAQVANRTEKALTGMRMANTTIQTTSSIIVADMMVNAAKIRADMIKNAALQDLLNEMMDRAIDTYSHRLESVSQIIRNISVVAENHMQAGKYITRQMNSVAG